MREKLERRLFNILLTHR